MISAIEGGGDRDREPAQHRSADGAGQGLQITSQVGIAGTWVARFAASRSCAARCSTIEQDVNIVKITASRSISTSDADAFCLQFTGRAEPPAVVAQPPLGCQATSTQSTGSRPAALAAHRGHPAHLLESPHRRRETTTLGSCDHQLGRRDEPSLKEPAIPGASCTDKLGPLVAALLVEDWRGHRQWSWCCQTVNVSLVGVLGVGGCRQRPAARSKWSLIGFDYASIQP